MGVQLDQELQLLTLTEHEKRYFQSRYNTDRDKLYFSILRYREEKIELQSITIDDFICRYKEDKLRALEELFMHPVIERDVRMLEQQIKKGQMTLERLYELKQKYKKRRLLRLLFSTTI